MGLLNILKNKKQSEPKLEFIDEDLTPEEINKKVSKMDWIDAEKYVAQLSPNKRYEAFKYRGKNLLNHVEKVNEEYIKEKGINICNYHDLEHSDCIDTW